MSWQLVPAQQLVDHAPAWDALQRRCTDTPFLETGFLLPLLQHFGSGRELLALHRQGGELNAAALLQPVGAGVGGVGAMWQTFQPSQLPLGPWLAAADADVQALTAALVATLPALALGLGLTQLDPRLHPRPADTPALRTQDYISTSWVDVAGPWEAYWEARGKNLRQNLRKAHNKLAAEGRPLRVDTITDPTQVAAALAQYGTLESTGWKAEGGTAIHPDNPQGRFYTQMLQQFCAAGRGRIVRGWLGDEVAAMDLCIDNGPLVVILKTAYDERHKAVSPSVLMRHEEFQTWWTEGRYQRIEFYGKTLEWHTRWTTQERVLYHATAYRWPLLRSLHEKLRGLRSPAPTAAATATAEPSAAQAPAPAPAPA